jgi:hypothetical protein
MRVLFSVLLILTLFFLSGCDGSPTQQTSQAKTPKFGETCSQPLSELAGEGTSVLNDEDLKTLKIARGQKIYVPFYSQLYQVGGESALDLAGTLSIRNTSETESIIVAQVRYYNTGGKLVKDCIPKNALKLAPMATTEFEVQRSDRTGGSGANFIVEWVAEKEVSDPVVESIMITASGTQGYTFLSQGRVIEELK